MMARNEKGTGSLYQAKDKTWVYYFNEERKLYGRAHVKPMIGEKYMNTITADELQAFFNDCGANGNLQRQGGLSPKTLTNIRNMMHIAFDQALKNGMITVNFVESVRLPNFDDSIETATSVKTVESTKTSSSRRTVYMTDSLYKDFRQYMNIQLSQKTVPVLQPGRVRLLPGERRPL